MTLAELLAAIGAIVGPAAVMYSMHVNRLRERDKLGAETESKALTAQTSEMKSSIARCEKDCGAAREQAVAAMERKDAAELKAARMEGEFVSLNRENKELREENHALRERLYGSKP